MTVERDGRRGSAGTSLVEILVSMLLTCLVATLVLVVAARQRGVQEALARRTELLGAVRVTRYVLQSELRGAVGPRDLAAVGGDSLSARIFRGVGFPCGAQGPGELLVTVEGIRLPDPAKDSVLVLVPEAGWVTRALAAVTAAPSSCGPSGPGQRWTFSEPLPGVPSLVRYFERGSYHLAASAFRYRRGAGGRQPVTGEAFATGSGFEGGAAGVVVRLLPADGSTPWIFRVTPGGAR